MKEHGYTNGDKVNQIRVNVNQLSTGPLPGAVGKPSEWWATSVELSSLSGFP